MTTLLGVTGQRPGQPQHHDLPGAGVAADPHLGVQPRLGGIRVAGRHRDDPARVFVAGGVGGLDRFLEQSCRCLT